MPQLLLLLFLCIGSAGLTAQPAVVLEQLAETFTEPTDLVSDGFNTDYLYVVEKPGFVNRYDLEGGAVSLVLDLSDQVEDNGEGGALGMAFHPAFPDSNYVYVNYTAPAPAGQGDLVSRISRFTLDNVGIVFDLSERILLSIPQPAGNHNAGDLVFGPDGYLYIPLGDGGGGNDQYDNAQDPTSLLGSLLRIDVDSTTGDQNYAVPADNPYVNSGDTLPEIYAMGLRNPWRISFDREGGGLWIADVGQGRREEVNYVAAGAGAGTNFGWNCREGLMAFGSPSSRCAGRTAEDFTDPVLDYAHDESQRVNGTSITGGFVYRGDAEDLRGYYVFGDFGRQRLFLYPADSDAGADDIIVYDDLAAEKISTFGEGVNGELYVADISGRIYLVTTEAATPTDETRSVYSQMRVFPNPASDRVTVDLSAPVSGEATVSYRSVDGRVAARDVTARFSNGRADLLVPELPAGIYMLSTFVEGKRFMARIVFQ